MIRHTRVFIAAAVAAAYAPHFQIRNSGTIPQPKRNSFKRSQRKQKGKK